VPWRELAELTDVGPKFRCLLAWLFGVSKVRIKDIRRERKKEKS
jgi:hypothetical protein